MTTNINSISSGISSVYTQTNVNAGGIELSSNGQLLSTTYPSPLTWVPKVLPYLRDIAGFGSSISQESNEIAGIGFPVRLRMPSTYYPVGAVFATFWGKLQECIQAGTTSSDSGPDSSSIPGYTDGTAKFRYLSTLSPYRWQATQAVVYGDYRRNKKGRLMKCVVAGTTSSTEPTPSAGSTVVDGTASWIGLSETWIDSVNGNDANDGLTFANRKKSLPATLASNTHYWIVAGSKFYFDVNVSAIAVTVSAANASMTVVDGVTGNEIVDHENPFLTVLKGRWYNPADVDKKYFSIIGNGPSLTSSTVTGTNGKGFQGTAGNTSFKLRGAYIYGFPYAGIVAQAGGFWDVSDVILQSNKTTQDISKDSGVGIRFEGATVNGANKFRRYYIADSGTDAFWASATAQAADWTVSDFAIHHKPTINFVDSHADGMQFGKYPGAAVIRRGIIEHDLTNVNVLPDISIGSALIGDGSGTAGTSSFTVEDVIAISNRTTTNFQGTTANPYNRCIFALVGGLPGQANLHVQNSAWSLSNSVNILYKNNAQSGDKFYWYQVPTKTNVMEMFDTL